MTGRPRAMGGVVGDGDGRRCIQEGGQQRKVLLVPADSYSGAAAGWPGTRTE